MKKSDVETYYDHGIRYPAVNVKNHLWIPDLIRKYKGNNTHEFSDDAGFWAWLEDAYDNDTLDDSSVMGADESARENCWEQATELAHEIWPQYSTEFVDGQRWDPERKRMVFTGEKVPHKRYHVTVYGLGRQGGHCCVDGLDDIESWDAIALGRWAKFAKAVRFIADEEYPYQFIWQLAANVWEPIQIERENAYPAPAYA